MTAYINLISGVNVGFEIIKDDDEGNNYFIVDLFIIRIVFGGEDE